MPEVLLPGVIGPGLFVGLLYSVPFLDHRFAGDDAEHHVLDRPRDRPVRTAIGMGVLTFLGLLLLGGSQDLLAEWLDARVGHVTGVLQVVVLTVPVLVALLTWRGCKDLCAGDERARRHRRGTTVEEGGAAQPVEPSPTGAATPCCTSTCSGSGPSRRLLLLRQHASSSTSGDVRVSPAPEALAALPAPQRRRPHPTPVPPGPPA